ncbi:MAG: GTP-binding protein [Alphaproteobacteria bacterium]|nr:GTP-binding protein [Alphaproteobacteria bacterium]
MTDAANSRRLVAEWDFLLSSLQGGLLEREPVSKITSHVPVTVLAGFLGAGKTTMLAHLLQGDHGQKLAAVVNDVGALNIDAAMIANRDGDVLELTNGCSCCSLGPELARSLDQLCQRESPPDGIVIEASGVADPAGIGVVIAGATGVRLDGIVTVIDGSVMTRWLEHGVTATLFQRQLDAAHLLVLNKADLIDGDEIKAATERLAQLAPGRPVIVTEQGRLDPELALGAAYRGARPDPGHYGHDTSRFASHSIELGEPIDRHRLAALLADLPSGLIRVKGFVETFDAPGQRQTVQAVGRQWCVEPTALGLALDIPDGLVLIGLADQAEAWLWEFKQCLLSEP